MAHMNTSALIQKVWNFCHTLRDDGVGYGDYLEQLTCLLFLKIARASSAKTKKSTPFLTRSPSC
jgi:type I restriction-modification system DNA methylase subunit